MLRPGEFHTKVVGTSKKNEDDESIQKLLKDISEYCYEGQPLSLEHESDNPYDKNAIKVFFEFDHIGYINKDIAKELASLVDQQRAEAELCEITGGENGKSFGCNILIRVVPEGEIARTDSREYVHLGCINGNNASIKFVDAAELQSWPNEKFFAWGDGFLKYGKNLPRTMDQTTLNAVQKQLDIINAEIDRRYNVFQAMQNKINAYRQPSQAAPTSRLVPQQTQGKDWTDKIAPFFPLVCILWFCGIAGGTFFLLSLIFK